MIRNEDLIFNFAKRLQMKYMNQMVRAISVFSILVFMSLRVGAENVDTVRYRQVRPAERVVSATSAVAVNLAFTEVLKKTVHEMRPDRSSCNSFPSRHTSWSFTASTVISHELYDRSPWWCVGSQALASAVGLQRVMSERHFGSDVVAGATLGIASTELAYWIVGRLFGGRPYASRSYNDFRTGLSLITEAQYNLDGDMCTGFGSAVRFQLPFTSQWGAVASMRVSSAPVKTSDGRYRPLDAVGATVGMMGHFVLPDDCLALEPVVEAGGAAMKSTAGFGHSRYCFEAGCALGLSWRLTENFAFRAEAGYRLRTLPRAVSAITAGVSSVAFF